MFATKCIIKLFFFTFFLSYNFYLIFVKENLYIKLSKIKKFGKWVLHLLSKIINKKHCLMACIFLHQKNIFWKVITEAERWIYYNKTMFKFQSASMKNLLLENLKTVLIYKISWIYSSV